MESKRNTPKKSLPHTLKNFTPDLKNLYPINTINKENNKENNSSSSYSACAQDKNNNYYISLLTQWARAAALPEQFEREFYRREKIMPDFDEMVKEFYEGDFAAREETQRNERTEVLRHLTNWIRNQKIKDNGNNNTTRNQGTADKPKAVVQDDRDMPYDWFCNKERVETE